MFSPPLSPLSPSVEGGDGLSQLTALVKKGEEKAMFSQGMPPQIRRSVSYSFIIITHLFTVGYKNRSYQLHTFNEP